LKRIVGHVTDPTFGVKKRKVHNGFSEPLARGGKDLRRLPLAVEFENVGIAGFQADLYPVQPRFCQTPDSRLLCLPERGCPRIARQSGDFGEWAPEIAYDLDEFLQADLQRGRVAEKSCRGSGEPRSEHVDVSLHLRNRAGRKGGLPEGKYRRSDIRSGGSRVSGGRVHRAIRSVDE
jgi:hypothetical protein